MKKKIEKKLKKYCKKFEKNLQKFCKKLLQQNLQKVCINFANILQLHILQNVLHFRSGEEAVIGSDVGQAGSVEKTDAVDWATKNFH